MRRTNSGVTCPVLEESKGTARLQGTSVCDTCWEQDLTLAPESERGDDRTPGLGAFMRAPGEGRSFPPGHPHYQPPPATTTLEEQQASWRAEREEWEARDLDAQAELDRLWAQAYLPSDLI